MFSPAGSGKAQCVQSIPALIVLLRGKSDLYISLAITGYPTLKATAYIGNFLYN